MQNDNKAIVFALLAILAWSTVATAFKLALEHGSPISLVFYASLFSLLFLAIVNYPNIRKYRKAETIKNIRSSLLPGLINPFVYYIVLFNSYDLLPAAHAQIINYSWGIILAVVSAIVFRRKLRMMSLLGIMISFCGTAFVIFGSTNESGDKNPFGYLLAFGSAFLWAIYWIINMKDRREEKEKLFWNFFVSFLFLLIYSLIEPDMLTFNTKLILYSAYIGAFEMGFTFILWGKALYYSNNTAKISNIIYLSPFLSLILINAVLKEAIEMSAVLGLMLIVVGLIVNFTQKQD